MCYRKYRCLGPRVWAVRSALIGSAEDFQGFRNRIWFSCSEMGRGWGNATAGVRMRA